MPKVFTSKSQKTGEIGEHLAARYLASKGYKIIERNYTKKWGEIDIIARKGNSLHFVEVKSQLVPSLEEIDRLSLRPEENMHPQKLKRLGRSLQTYLLEKSYAGNWQFDLLVVFIDQETEVAKIRVLEDIVL